MVTVNYAVELTYNVMSSDLVIKKHLELNGEKIAYVSLPALEEKGYHISKLPLSIRIILESLLRNRDGTRVKDEHIVSLLNWKPESGKRGDVPFIVSRVVMQDFTGVPGVVDLAAMRDAMASLSKDPSLINPSVPVDLVIDHSVQVDKYGTPLAFEINRDIEFERNGERYRFLKWAQESLKNLRVIPPSTGIIHQVNLEFLGKVVHKRELNGETYAIPDTLVGTDSHTTMINGLGIVGWGVGGIEAEAAILGEPITFVAPDVIGVHLHGSLKEGTNATDLVLTITEILRRENVVGKFVEFFGDGVASLSVTDRATLSNMCPEYGATLALFPVDSKTLEYLHLTGRSEEQIKLVEEYMKAQGLFGIPENIDYTRVVDIDLGSVETTISGPKLPQQKLTLGNIGNSFIKLVESGRNVGQTVSSGPKKVVLKSSSIELKGNNERLSEGDVVIAAITSCTNTSNPRVMIGAGLLAKKAYERGLRVNPKVKTSLAPGSRVVTEYLERSGLQDYLNKLGFYLVGYGCTTCIGNSGPLDPAIEKAIEDNDLYVAAVLSGNRNFEARIHKDVRGNYLMSPPLVVAFALAGTVLKDLSKDPVGVDSNGKNVYLKDIWPDDEEINSVLNSFITRELFVEKYKNVESGNDKWNSIDVSKSDLYRWDPESTYIRKIPFFDGFDPQSTRDIADIENARPLLILGDSVTTDHISPAGSIPGSSPAGRYLLEHGVRREDFNSYGSRRGNHEVMMRGTFGNTRIRNKLVDREGGYTKILPEGTETTVFEASEEYRRRKTPLIVFAGKQYGTGSSRDWAAKGPMLLGVRAVIAESYERIHRSNLVGMGIIPLEFQNGMNFERLEADIEQPFNIRFDRDRSSLSAKLLFTGKDGKEKSVPLTVRLDSEVELEYYRYGGILQYAMANIVRSS